MKLKIEKLNHQGQGIGKIDGKVIFVNNALPGEVVEIIIIKENKKYSIANVLKYHIKNDKRIESKCKYYNECGGCQLSHISYDDEIIFKQNKINEIFSKINVHVNDIVKSKSIYKYRNKITLKCKDDSLGYYEKDSNNFIKIEKCLLCDDIINKQIKEFKKSNFDNIIFKNYKSYTYLNDYKFFVEKDSFFQINKGQTLKIYNKIKDYIKLFNNPNVLDLYCGVGSIGIFISSYSKKVLGIEINKNAIKCANKNKIINKINNINFIISDSDKIKDKINFNPNVIIVDPPRAGLSKKTINILLNIHADNIIYLSCNPMTLIRDLNILSDYYDIKEVTPYDMFPRTFHIETLCFLKKKN